MIGNDGIFEGRGWSVSPEAPQLDRGNISVGFFTDSLRGPEATTLYNVTLPSLIEDGKMIGKLSNDARFVCAILLCSAPPTLDDDTTWTSPPPL